MISPRSRFPGAVRRWSTISRKNKETEAADDKGPQEGMSKYEVKTREVSLGTVLLVRIKLESLENVMVVTPYV